MRALIQRVTHAQVDVDGKTVGSIGTGLLILLGVGTNDTEAQVDKLWGKISKMRIFEDEAGKTNLSLADVSGEVLVVSQFTLYASCKKGESPLLHRRRRAHRSETPLRAVRLSGAQGRTSRRDGRVRRDDGGIAS